MTYTFSAAAIGIVLAFLAFVSIAHADSASTCRRGTPVDTTPPARAVDSTHAAELLNAVRSRLQI